MTLAYVALSMHLPLELHPDFGADDGWFYHHARFLIDGQWFGPYSQMTLMKGPGYVFFLAINHVLGLPISLSHAVLQIAACALFARAIQRISGSTLLAAAIFTVCLWHPYLISSRVIRDAIYTPQTLILFGCLLLMLTAEEKGRRLAWAVAAGLSFTWLCLTREEGVWVLPGLALIALVVVWRRRSRIYALLQMGVTIVCAFAALATCDFVAYRTWSIVDFKGGAYSRAVNALQSVRVGSPVPYVPAPAKVRARIYQVSPTFAALKPYLEGPAGRALMEPGCQIYPTTCDDYAGGWFIWVLRDAAAWAGAYRTPADADRFYATMASEITAACRSGRLVCEHPIIDFLPQITPEQWRTLPAKLRQLADFVLARDPADRWNSGGGGMAVEDMADFVGYPRRTPMISETLFNAQGWYRGGATTWIQVRCGGTVIPVNRQPSPDVAKYFHDPAAGQVRFNARMIGENCGLQAQGAGPNDPTIGIDIKLPTSARLAGGQLFIERRAGFRNDRVLAQSILQRLVKTYAILTPILLAVAAAAYLAHLVQLARGAARVDLYWWTIHALWLLAMTRCVILVLVDISSFPGLTMLYLGPIFPLVLSAALLTVGLPFRSAGQTLRWRWPRLATPPASLWKARSTSAS